MSDIYDIKNVILFAPHLRTETWYVIGICIAIYVIHIFFLILSERYRKMGVMQQFESESSYDLKFSFLKKLSEIDTEDAEFFVKINYLIRLYLERVNLVPNAVKKTSEEVGAEFHSDSIRTLLTTCTLYEYALRISTTEEREFIRRLAEEALRNTNIRD